MYLIIAFLSEYVSEHWEEEDFYGFQFLNAINPNIIKRCSELPSNFPVTDEMVRPFLENGSSLQKEMEVSKIKESQFVTNLCNVFSNSVSCFSFLKRKAISSSTTRRGWMEYQLENIMVNLCM